MQPKPNKQYKVKINTTFSENKSAGVGARYLNSGEITARNAIEIACTCLFAPIGGATAGESLEKVKARQAVSRAIFENYMNLALSRVEISESELEDLAAQENNFLPTTDTSPIIENQQQSLMELEETFENSSNLAVANKEEILTEINFDDEEF